MLPALFFSLLLSSSLTTCLGQCTTSPENRRLECSNLYDFPRGSESIEVLQATNNTFIKIASNALQQQEFASLKVAVLRYDNIRALGERAFNGLSSLFLLDLSGNNLEGLQARAFEGADSLKILILARNRMRGIHSHAFGSLGNLIFLDLSQNNLIEVPVDFLAPLPLIKYLDISHNPLALSQPGPFLVSSSLVVLRVSLTESRGVTRTFFAGLPNLQVLDLSGSNLKVWPAPLLRPLRALRVLYVHDLINGDPLVPTTVEKIVQSEMDVTSGAFVSKVLENLDSLNVSTKDEEFLQFLEDYIYETSHAGPNWQFFIKKCLLFALLVYLSLMYCLCFAQIAKSFIYKPYQLVYIDEI